MSVDADPTQSCTDEKAKYTRNMLCKGLQDAGTRTFPSGWWMLGALGVLVRCEVAQRRVSMTSVVIVLEILGHHSRFVQCCRSGTPSVANC